MAWPCHRPALPRHYMNFCSVSASTLTALKEYIQSQLQSKSINFSAVCCSTWTQTNPRESIPPPRPISPPASRCPLCTQQPRHRASAYSQVFAATSSQEVCTSTDCFSGAPVDCDCSSLSGKISDVSLEVQVSWMKWTDFIDKVPAQTCSL